jgi:hypothetical protein
LYCSQREVQYRSLRQVRNVSVMLESHASSADEKPTVWSQISYEHVDDVVDALKRLRDFHRRSHRQAPS